jgi:hypothetical protein
MHRAGSEWRQNTNRVPAGNVAVASPELIEEDVRHSLNPNGIESSLKNESEDEI